VLGRVRSSAVIGDLVKNGLRTKLDDATKRTAAGSAVVQTVQRLLERLSAG
jgi:hypothetical protein